MKLARFAAAPLAFVLLTGCQATLGPDDAWYTFRNDKNNFARLEIDGRVTGATYRPGESRSIPLNKTRDHTIVVERGTYTQVLLVSDFEERYVVDFAEPPYTVRWADDGWRITP